MRVVNLLTVISCAILLPAAVQACTAEYVDIGQVVSVGDIIMIIGPTGNESPGECGSGYDTEYRAVKLTPSDVPCVGSDPVPLGGVWDTSATSILPGVYTVGDVRACGIEHYEVKLCSCSP